MKQKQLPQTLMTKVKSVKKKIFYILLVFLLITIVLLVAVSIYCYLIKYKSKQKYLLPFHVTNNEPRTKFYINECIIKKQSNDKFKKIDIKNRSCYTSMI